MSETVLMISVAPVLLVVLACVVWMIMRHADNMQLR